MTPGKVETSGFLLLEEADVPISFVFLRLLSQWCHPGRRGSVFTSGGELHCVCLPGEQPEIPTGCLLSLWVLSRRGADWMLKGACFRALGLNSLRGSEKHPSGQWTWEAVCAVRERARAEQGPPVWEGKGWNCLRNFTREVFSRQNIYYHNKGVHVGESSLTKLPGLLKSISASSKFTPQRVIISIYCARCCLYAFDFEHPLYVRHRLGALPLFPNQRLPASAGWAILSLIYRFRDGGWELVELRFELRSVIGFEYQSLLPPSVHL